MPQHTMKRFDEELNQLKEHILAMGGLVERAIRDAVKCTLEQDEELAHKTIERDRAINAMEVQCDDLTRNILVRRQPAASDLRFIIACIKVVTDIERMGDLAAGIAEGMLHTRESPPKTYSNLEAMGEKTEHQVQLALTAFSVGDISLAMEVIEKDKKVDDLYKSMYREELTYMMEDPRAISSAIIMSNMAKNLERIADHATNVAEMVIYMIRGHDIRHVDHGAVAELLKSND